MVETRPFKTKLCVLYEKGRCGRDTCTFAHGDSDLRRFSGYSAYPKGPDLIESGYGSNLKFAFLRYGHPSVLYITSLMHYMFASFKAVCTNSGLLVRLALQQFITLIFKREIKLAKSSVLHSESSTFAIPDRPINRDNDLRSKLDRKRSPLHKSSPRRDANGSRAYKRFSPSQPSKRRKLRTHEHEDGRNKYSGGFKCQNGSAESEKDKLHILSNSRNVVEDELTQLEYEVDVLFNQKSQMEIAFQERVQEADNLSSRIRDLEAQLCDEKEKSKRVNSKIKKLIRAHVHHSRMQDELKRQVYIAMSQIQLEQLVGELGTDAIPIVSVSENLDVNVISNEEFLELKDSASPAKKQAYVGKGWKGGQEKLGIGYKGSLVADWLIEHLDTLFSLASTTARGHGARVLGSRRNPLVSFGGHQEAEAGLSEENPQLQNIASKHFDPYDKVKESNFMVPPTSMAAHAVDFIELMEAEENPEMLGTPKCVENSLPFLLPPLPTVSQNNYIQYEGDDENVDVDGLEELEEVYIV
uniref:C3H1-type domain-containing protein n=1 Tax=Chenopodium quinoa TaxID=63459 RepID=A0A803M836_CHEQI